MADNNADKWSGHPSIGAANALIAVATVVAVAFVLFFGTLIGLLFLVGALP